MDDLIQDFYNSLMDLVNEKKPWTEKRRLILKDATADQTAALQEFISWFDESGKDTEV